ncbi:MAG: AAA family ATPase [Bacillota bacterium]
MIIKSLYVGDFGIFQTQRMENIGPGLVVIGGPNRAGKTTLMNVLRFLGFGLLKSTTIPAAVKHEISAELAHAQKRFHVKVDGYASPKAFLASKNREKAEVDLEELYGKIDVFTYRQVFTISLDELQRIPEGLEKNEKDKLSAVLLGAGWSDSFQLMELKEEFNKAASKIGGTKGTGNAREFKDHYNELKEGLDLLEQANAQLDEYNQGEKRLQDLKEQQQKNEEEHKSLSEAMQRLNLLERHFERSHQINQLKVELKDPGNKRLLEKYPASGKYEAATLKERHKTTREKYNEAADNFISLTSQPAGSNLYASLLEYGSKLEELSKKLSGWREGIRNLYAKRQELAEREKNLAAGVRKVFGQKKESEALFIVDNIKADRLNLQDLVSKVDQVKKCSEQLKEKEARIKDIAAILAEKEKQREALPSFNGALLKKVLLAAGLDAALVVLLYFLLTPATAVAVGLIIGAGISAYFLRQDRQDKLIEWQEFELGKAISDLAQEKKALENRHQELSARLEESNNALEKLKESCNIPGEVQADYLVTFINEVNNMQKENRAIGKAKEELKAEEEKLQKDLSTAASILQATGLLKDKVTDCISEAETIFSALEKALEYLEAARQVEHKHTAATGVEKEIESLLKREDSTLDLNSARQTLASLLEDFYRRGEKHEELVQKQDQLIKEEKFLLEELNAKGWPELLLGDKSKNDKNDEALIKAFKAWCEEFTVLEEIAEKLQKTRKEMDELNEEMEKNKKEIWQLENKLERLKTDKKVTEAHVRINAARRKLEVRAEEYAVYRAAQYMVDKTYSTLLEKTKSELLAPASETFRTITGSDYLEIEPPGETGKLDFAVKQPDGSNQEADKLSRATREQLFFSVRLSRINAIKPELPVILDDTLANFDPVHTRQAVEFISQLSKTHQVFVFTCHPELIEHLDASNRSNIQYWGLEKGKFKGPFAESSEVAELLLQET